MPEVTRVVRSSFRDRDGDYSSDDERSSSFGRSKAGASGTSYRTVQRYRVTPSRVEEVEEDRRSSRLELPRGERIEVDRRVERFEVDRPERPRSSIDIRPRSTVVERYVERERDPIREPDRERTRTVVYERERDRPRETESARSWDRRDRPWEFERDARESDVTVEKRVVERREEVRRDEPYELERYQREIEYYDRPEPPQPIIIRQRAPEPQKIIVQEAAPLPPIILPREEQGFQVIRRAEVQQEVVRPEPRREEDEYYYRQDVREVGPRRDEDFAIARYDRREVRSRDSVSEGELSDGSDYVVRRRVVKTQEERSRSPHHKRHLAEGALAGAGVAALLANHREKTGNAPEHRGRNVVGGAALGAIGTELVTRARSRYRERQDDRSRSRSRSSSRHSHRKVKTALGLAVAGLAAAAAAKYVSNRNANKAELGRGRSRTRSVSRRRGSGAYDDDYDSDTRARSRSRHNDPKHRVAAIAKAGAATAAVAGVVEHFRNKSRKRSGERSRSRLRTGAEIAGAGLAGAAVAGLYENRKAKEDQEGELERAKRERRRSRSRARSTGAHSDPGVDPELGLVQYGTEPVITQHTTTYRGYDYDPALDPAAAAYGANRSRSRSHRRRHSSSTSDDRRHGSRSRSRSRVRDIAGVAAASGAAAIGVHQYKKRKERKEAERERERRRYEEEAPPENYYANDHYEDNYSPSPPHASGGSYYPATNDFAPPPNAGFTQHTTHSTTHINEPPIPPYNPQDYAAQPGAAAPHDPYGYPPPRAGDNVSAAIPPQTAVPVPPINVARSASEVPYFPPPPMAPLEPNEHLRDEGRINTQVQSPPFPAHPTPPSSRSVSPHSPLEDDRPHNKSVMFAPLSPTSSRRLDRIHASKSNPTPPNSGTYHPPDEGYADDQVYDDPSNSERERSHHRHRHRTSDEDETGHKRHRHRRRNSDPSSDRPNLPSKHRRRNRNASRSPSPASSDIEELPPRFDRHGRPLDGTRGGGGGQGEIVEKIMHDFGDVVDGRKSWKDLLGGLMESGGLGALGGGGGVGGAGSGSDRESGSRKKRRS